MASSSGRVVASAAEQLNVGASLCPDEARWNPAAMPAALPRSRPRKRNAVVFAFSPPPKAMVVCKAIQTWVDVSSFGVGFRWAHNNFVG